ncbi:DUF4430 domain-containing protein [Clostridium tetani]|nr:DUF4430 domain-containing protein [Clostridium tetani]
MASNSILEGASTVNAGEDFEVVYKEKDGKGIKNGEIKYYKANEYDYKGINKGKVKPIGTSIKTDEQGKAKIKLEAGKYFITAEANGKARAKALEVDVKGKVVDKIKVKVRVEGPDYTILPETEVEVEKGAGNKEVLEAAGLKVEEMAGMIESIEDIKAKGWWSVEPYLPNVSNGDNILFNGNGAMASNSILEGASTVNAGEDFEVVYKEKDGKGIKNGEIKYYKANEYDYKGINKGKVKPIGTSIKTDEQGKAKIKLEAGKYFITAEANGKARAKALKVEVEKIDAPIIKVFRLEDNKVSHKSSIVFEVEAEDSNNKKIMPIVKIREETIKPFYSKSYHVVLEEGKNIITVVAKDENGKESKKVFQVQYIPKIKINIRVEGINSTILPGKKIEINKGASQKEILEKAGLTVTEENGQVKTIQGEPGNPNWTVISKDNFNKENYQDVIFTSKNADKTVSIETLDVFKTGEEFVVTIIDENKNPVKDAEIKYYTDKEYNYEDINLNRVQLKNTGIKTNKNGQGKIKFNEEGKYYITGEKDRIIRGKATIVQVFKVSQKLNIILPKETINNYFCTVKVIDENGEPVKGAQIAYAYMKNWLINNFDSAAKGITDENGEAIIKVSNNNFDPKIYFQAKKGDLKSEFETIQLISERYSIKIKPQKQLLQKGEEYLFDVDVKHNRTKVKEEIKWESLNPEIATINKKGQVTAINEGDAIIRALIKKDTRYYTEGKIKVASNVVKANLRVELKNKQDYSGEIRVTGEKINLEDVLKNSRIIQRYGEKRYEPKFNEEGKLISIGKSYDEKGKPYFSVIINGKVIENHKDTIIKQGDNIILSYNGAINQLQVEAPKECESGETFEVIIKDEYDKKVKDCKVFLEYFKPWNGAWDRKENSIVDENGKVSFTPSTKGKYRVFAEKDGYIRSAAKFTEVILPKIEGYFTKEVKSNEDFEITITATGKPQAGVKVYWAFKEDLRKRNKVEIGKTYENGKAIGKIDAPAGEYVLVVDFHNNIVELGNIIVLENDTQKPKIIVKGIKDNTVLSTKEVEFTVNVTDNVDENIIPEVKFNDKVITKKDGKYNVILEDGNNNIEIIARDKAGNIEKKKYTLIYKSDIIVNKIVIEGSKERLHPKDKITLKTKAVDEQNNVIPGKEFIFSSSDEKIATVDSKTGEVTAIGNGTVILTVALKDDNSIKENVKITITDKYEVYMRIEGYDHTILPRTKLEVGLFDLSEYLGKASGSSAGESNGWDVSKFEKPTNAHAIVKALVDAGFRQKKLEDTDESKLFDFQDYGWSLYISMIDGDREFDHDGMSGWLYRVNDDLPSVGCNDTPLNDGDEIVWMYSPYGFDNIYTKIFADETNVSVNDEVQINLIGYTGGYEKVEEKVDGATILVNGKSYIKDGKDVITDLKGNAVIFFKEPGRYTISVNRLDSKGLIDIIRPNPIIINVSDKKDTQKPKISLKDIINGETVNNSEITFTVIAEDPQDGKLTPIVKCNDKVINGKNDNYKVSLKEGKNIIFIQSKDKDNNIVEKTIEVICDTKDRTLPEIKVEGIESGITNAQETIFTVKASDEKDGRLNPVVKLNEKEIQDENGKYKVLLQEGLNTITIEAVNKVGNKATEIFKITYKKDTELPKNKEELRKKILEILPETVDYSTKESFSNDWVTAGLGRLKDYKNRISPNYLEDTKKIVKELVAEQDKGSRTFKVTDFQRITMGILGAGGNPTDIGGINIIERIYNPRKTDKGQDYIDRQGLNAVIWGLIAVDSKNYKIPEGSKWNRDKFIKEILDNECHNNEHPILKGKRGGWQYGGNKTIDPDMTGMAMIALAPYYETRKDVKLAVDRAVENLSLIQRQDGGYESWGTVNSESCVQVIMGLCANNFDPIGENFTKKDGSVVDALLRFKLESTGFAHAEDPQDDNKLKPNGMANEQALYGLAQLMYWLDGNKGSIFKWEDDKIEEPNQPQKSEKFIAKRIGKEKLKKNSNAEVKFHIENISKENEEVTLAVVLYDKNTNEMVNYSYVRKTLKAGEKEKFAGGFTIPQKGDYVVKAIICDSLNTDKMNVLTEPVEIAVE